MSLQDTTRIAKNFYQFFNENKIEDFLNLFSDNAVAVQVPTNVRFTGKEGNRQSIMAWKTAFPDGWCEITNQVVTENFIVTEFNGRGTHNGVLRTPMGDIPPTGSAVSLPIVEIIEVKNGHIENIRLYFDTGTMMYQLGIVPEKATQV